MGLSISFAAAVVALSVQSAANPPPLIPSGPWIVEYADSICVLQRRFGSGEQAVDLGFRPGFFSEYMRLAIVRKGREQPPVRGQAEISFDGGAPLKFPYSEHWSEKLGVRILLIDLKVPDLAPLGSAKIFRIKAGKDDFIFAPTNVAAAMKALDPCQKDLLVSWGMDPATIDSIVTFPGQKGGVIALFSSGDYPRVAISNDEQGTSGVRYWVSKEGKVRDCTVVESSGSVLLDKQTCAVISHRGKFQPARTKSGEAVESIGFARIRWELPSF